MELPIFIQIFKISNFQNSNLIIAIFPMPKKGGMITLKKHD